MGKRGPKPGFNVKRRISEKWSANLAYAIGLLATDGCMASKSTLIDLTSKDREQLKNFCKCVGVDYRITKKIGSNSKTYLRIQFKNVLFYDFLLSIGMTPAKSKTIGELKIPDKYFFDFLRGVFDGDGSFYSYWDSRWRSSFMYYTCFVSASPAFVAWLRNKLGALLGIRGHVSADGRGRTAQLKYAKSESLKLLRAIYLPGCISLSRKRLKITRALRIIGEQL